MPIYEYACPACDRAFEALLLRKSDEAEVACPTCRSRTVSRLLSRPAAMRMGGSGDTGSAAPSCGSWTRQKAPWSGWAGTWPTSGAKRYGANAGACR